MAELSKSINELLGSISKWKPKYLGSKKKYIEKKIIKLYHNLESAFDVDD